jgi:hypothetical protein
MFPDILPDVAEMVVDPSLKAVAKPLLSMEAMPVFDELHVTCAVKSCVVLSEKTPVAVNCLFVPLAIEGLNGGISIKTSWAAVTVRLVAPLIPDAVSNATMEVVPVPTVVATPVLLINATPAVDELQFTDVVRSFVVLSE